MCPAPQGMALFLVACTLSHTSAAAGPGFAIQNAGTQEQKVIAEAVEHPGRPQADIERDADSKPAAVLAFMGAKQGMSVFDMNSATGYYTELLARIVGQQGHVIAHNDPGATGMLGAAVFEERYGRNRLPNVEQMFAAHNDINLPNGSLDAVLMSMAYHDTYWFDPQVKWGPVDQQRLLRSLYDALKPGGSIVVLDHRAAAGIDPKVSAKATHRIDPDVVREDFAAAGFVLDWESDLFANPADDLGLIVFDLAVKGRTDRFLLRFIRPPWR